MSGTIFNFDIGLQTTSFNDFSIEAGILLRGNGVSHAMLDVHMLLARGLSRCYCFAAYSTHSFLHPPTFLTYCIPYAHSHSRTPFLSVLSLRKDCLAVILMASCCSAHFRSSASYVVLVVSSESTILLVQHQPRIDIV